MSDDEQSDEAGPASLIEAAGSIMAGVPSPIQRNFWKAVGRVFTAGAEWPAEWLEGKARVVKTNADAKASAITSRQRARELIDAESAKIAARGFKDPKQAQRAFAYHAAHIVEEQENREKVIEIAAHELKRLPAPQREVGSVDDDWMTLFLKEASSRSSEDFHIFFGRILAGEVSRPGTFSFSTLQSLGKLTQEIAEVFQISCNVSTYFYGVGAKVIDTFTLGAGSNGLKKFGLSYHQFARLVEYGLIRPEFSESIDLANMINSSRSISFDHSNTHLRLSIEGSENLPENSFVMRGPAFTQVGNELRSIVSIKRNEQYFREFSDWLTSLKLTVLEVHET